ncbi:MAG: hypothetical protein SGJ20_01810 [Planctomycetota bacterium]|nr:hypothetical protein [Planctomycetota bacterium]
MPIKTQKFLAVGALCMLVGALAGAYFGPLFFAPPVPVVVNGEPLHVDGLAMLPRMAGGGFIGGAAGLVAGLLLAWALPTPRNARSISSR